MVNFKDLFSSRFVANKNCQAQEETSWKERVKKTRNALDK